MEKSWKMEKTEQRAAIQYAFNTLKARGVIKSQKQFAHLLGVSEQTISYAFNDKGRSLNESLVRKITDFMFDNYSIDIFTPAANIFMTGDAISAPKAPADTSIKMNDENVSRLLNIIDEKNDQINRLLTLLENEQKKHL